MPSIEICAVLRILKHLYVSMRKAKTYQTGEYNVINELLYIDTFDRWDISLPRGCSFIPIIKMVSPDYVINAKI